MVSQVTISNYRARPRGKPRRRMQGNQGPRSPRAVSHAPENVPSGKGLQSQRPARSSEAPRDTACCVAEPSLLGAEGSLEIRSVEV